jgi:hypothetical protein
MFMKRRLATIALATFYLLQATWLLHAGADLLFPRIRQIAAAAGADCCTNTCGCPEEAKKNNTCCCLKGAAEAPIAKAKPRPVSSIEEARCRGVEAAMSQAFTQPVVCRVAVVTLPVTVASEVLIPDRIVHFIPAAEALLKVPIAQA